MTLGPGNSAHVDTFCSDNLPPRDTWPELVFSLDDLQYPPQLNCAGPLLDNAITEGFGEKVAIIHKAERWRYCDVGTLANQYAHVLVSDFGLVPGNRVLLRGGNTPQLVAAWFAVIKAGLVAVTTMPLLRAKELAQIADKAQIHFGLCDESLMEETEALPAKLSRPFTTLSFGKHGELDNLAADKPKTFLSVQTAQDDVCLLAFTSGTTGEPKACIHFHRDVMAMCDTFSRHILKPTPDDIFTGTPPLAFTFGLGALLAFPFHARASVAFPNSATPKELLATIKGAQASIVLTSPTAYRAMLADCDKADLASLSKGVSAGEHLPEQVSLDWQRVTGTALINGIGATEMIHIFIAAGGKTTPLGTTGKPVPGFQAVLLNDDGEVIEGPGEGRLAVKGPVGCRYLNDARQTDYVANGWNITGDRFARDEEGWYWYRARSDAMIVSSGYNIAAPEVEQALLTHPDVAQCAVIGAPDKDRGQIVKAFIVAKAPPEDETSFAKALQAHAKQTVAPYKYPRQIVLLNELPTTSTGKISLASLRKL